MTLQRCVETTFDSVSPKIWVTDHSSDQSSRVHLLYTLPVPLIISDDFFGFFPRISSANLEQPQLNREKSEIILEKLAFGVTSSDVTRPVRHTTHHYILPSLLTIAPPVLKAQPHWSDDEVCHHHHHHHPMEWLKTLALLQTHTLVPHTRFLARSDLPFLPAFKSHSRVNVSWFCTSTTWDTKSNNTSSVRNIKNMRSLAMVPLVPILSMLPVNIM